MSTLQDNRRYQAMSVADALFLRIARLKAAIDREGAAYKKRLAEMEEAHRAKIAFKKGYAEQLEA